MSAVIVRSAFYNGTASTGADSISLSQEAEQLSCSWTEIALIRGTCPQNVFDLTGLLDDWGGAASSQTLTLDRTNVTDHATPDHGRAGYYEFWAHMKLEFCAFERNSGRNGFYLHKIEATDIRCLAVQSNHCTETFGDTVLFFTDGGAKLHTIKASLFTNSTVMYFVGSSGLTFSNCYFDTVALPCQMKPSS
jgi:hypothetical protein